MQPKATFASAWVFYNLLISGGLLTIHAVCYTPCLAEVPFQSNPRFGSFTSLSHFSLMLLVFMPHITNLKNIFNTIPVIHYIPLSKNWAIYKHRNQKLCSSSKTLMNSKKHRHTFRLLQMLLSTWHRLAPAFETAQPQASLSSVAHFLGDTL